MSFWTPRSDKTLDACVGALFPAPDARPPGERLATDAVRTVLKRLAAKAGVDPHLVTPHRLRHYFGLTSAMAGGPA